MKNLNYDLKLQFSEYLNNNFITSWFKLLQLDKDFYQMYLYMLRKNRYILTANEIKMLENYIYFIFNNDRAFQTEASNGHLQVVKYLVQQGANIYSSGNYAFKCAVIHGDLNVLKYLVTNGVDIHYDDDIALRIAARKGHLNVIKYLISHGANVNVLTAKQRQKYGILT